MRIVIEDALTVTMNAMRDVDTYTIVIRDDRIESLEKERVSPEGGDLVLNAKGMIAMPGLVNGHVHADMALARGLADGLTLYEQDHASFVSEKKWFREELGGEARALGKLLQYVESVKGGTTFLCDVPFWFYGEDLVKPFREVGLDGAVVVDFREDFLTGKGVHREEYFEIARELKRNGILPVVEGPAEEDYDRALLAKLRGWAEELDTYIQMHLAETAWRMEIMRERFGTSSVRFLKDTGVLSDRIIGSHGVFIDDEEIGLLEESGARIVNCPTAEMKISDGVAPVSKLISRGVPTGLGSDGALWNDSGDMFSEMKSLMLLQRVSHGASSVSAWDCLGAATVSGAAVFGLGGNVGSIEPGKRASLILVDYMKPHGVPCYSGRRSNVAQVITSCLRASDVDTVIIGGKPVVKGGRVLTVDEDALVTECQELGSRIFKNMA